MTFPAGLTLVVVHGRIDALPSGGASGQACFTRPYALVGGADNSIVPPRPEYATLNATGEFTISLPATNDPDWTPVNWAYSVEILSSSGVIRGTVQLNYQTPAVELADVIQIDGTTSTGTTYIPLSARGAAAGVAGLDVDGDVNDAAGNKITGGGGGGASPSGSVVSGTSYGQATAVGAAATFSRGDHSHGTPALGTSGTTAAAGNHAHSGVYDPAGTAAAAVFTHAGLADPHTAYALETDVTASLALKAPLASPGLTGVPTAPTAAGGTNTTQLATTAFVTTAVAGGGGGGSALVVKRAVVSSGNITPQNTAGAWAALTGGPTLVIPAAAGDYIAAELMACLMTKDNATFYDLAVLNGASLVRFGSSGTGTPASEGDGSLYPDTAFPRSGTVFDFVAEAGDINAGNITICFAVKSGGAGVLHAGFYPLRWRVLNHGAATVS
jgi:hypothetical protein